MLIKDKIKPIFIKDFIINKQIVEKYKSILTNEFISNTYIYGSNGCGKYTIIKCLLNELYKTNITSKIQTLVINNKEFNILYNNYYFEIILHKYNTNRVQVLNVLEYLTENKDINSMCNYKIIIIKNCHLLNASFITNLKNIIEKYHETIRLILIGKTNSRLLHLLKGVVIPIRIGKPDLNEIKTFFKKNNMYKKNIDIEDLVIKNNYNLNYIFINYEISCINPKYKTLLQTTTDKITKLLIDKNLENINIQSILRIQTYSEII